MGRLPEGAKLDVNKIAVGCETPEERDGVLICQPTIEHKNKQIPLTNDGPIAVEELNSGNWRIREGGKDMTVEKMEAFKKALKKESLD